MDKTVYLSVFFGLVSVIIFLLEWNYRAKRDGERSGALQMLGMLSAGLPGILLYSTYGMIGPLVTMVILFLQFIIALTWKELLRRKAVAKFEKCWAQMESEMQEGKDE